MPLILELIKTVKSKPDNITTGGTTALWWACKRDMKEVAYELVSIGAFTINDLMSLKPEWVSEKLERVSEKLERVSEKLEWVSDDLFV